MSRMGVRVDRTFAVLAGVALAGALAGGAYAAKVPRNSVGTKQLKRAAVTAQKIRAQAVGASEIAKGAVGSDEIARAAVGSQEIAVGAVGADELAPGATPRAYAYVSGWPDIGIVSRLSRRMGSASATRQGTFVCFDEIPFTVRSIQPTILRQSGAPVALIANATIASLSDVPECPGSEDATVQFLDPSSGEPYPAPPGFTVLFYD